MVTLDIDTLALSELPRQRRKPASSPSLIQVSAIRLNATNKLPGQVTWFFVVFKCETQ